MSLLSVLMLVFWALVVLVVAFFLVREVRSRHTPVPELDGTSHDAVGESLTIQQRDRTRGQGIGF